MRRAISMAVAAGIVVSSLVVPVSSQAASSVGLSSQGIRLIKTYTDRDSTGGFITYYISDRREQARYITQCSVTGSGQRFLCDSYPLRRSYFPNGDWRVRATSSGWQVRVWVGWTESTPDQCLAESPRSAPWGVEIGVLGAREQLLVSTNHTYRMECQGFAVKNTGPTLITAFTKKRSQSITQKYQVVDTAHAIRRVQTCFYDPIRESWSNCRTSKMTSLARKTNSGWTMSQGIFWNRVTKKACRIMKRNPLRSDFIVTFYDRFDDEVARSTTQLVVTCKK